MIRTYTELQRLRTFEDRFNYLSLRGEVGRSTFGYDRYINQAFYTSREWRQLRSHIIVRDNGCDLGVDGLELTKNLIIHHINPMTAQDIVEADDSILDPEFLITTTLLTHNAVHYGTKAPENLGLVDRRPGDTKLW